MIKLCNIKIFLTLLFPCFLLVSCPPPGDGSPSPTHHPEPTPPGNVTARCAGEGFFISWDPVEGADYYKIYRQVGWGPVVLIAERCYETWYIDDYKTFKPVRYYIKSCTNDDASHYSDPTVYISLYVLNVKADRFSSEDRIELTWDDHQSAVAYRVYRYKHKADPEPVVFSDITKTNFNDFHDPGNPDSIQHDTPYYYRVTFIDDEKTEQGLEGPLVMGVFGMYKDFYEPNDDYAKLTNTEASSAFHETQPPLTYSFGDEAGGVDADVDWYVYYGLPHAFFVRTWLPADTPFGNGELRVQFYYPPAGGGGAGEPIYTNGTTVHGFNSFGDVPADEPVRVYFKVYPVLRASKDISGRYFLEITDEL